MCRQRKRRRFHRNMWLAHCVLMRLVRVWLCGGVGMWWCGGVVLWLCSYVVVWLFLYACIYVSVHACWYSPTPSLSPVGLFLSVCIDSQNSVCAFAFDTSSTSTQTIIVLSVVVGACSELDSSYRCLKSARTRARTHMHRYRTHAHITCTHTQWEDNGSRWLLSLWLELAWRGESHGLPFWRGRSVRRTDMAGKKKPAPAPTEDDAAEGGADRVDFDEAASKLAPHVGQSNVFNYGTKMRDSPVERDKIMPWAAGLRVLINAGLQAGSQAEVTTLFVKVHEIKQRTVPDWPLAKKDGDFIQKWAHTTALTVRTMCRHLSVAAAGGKTWAKERHMCYRCNSRFCYSSVALPYF
jgi:hypothetical protein